MSSGARRPNILLAIADDASHMSAYGHRFVNTPNFDRVARDGVLFTNAFTTNPKCAPSRASILTGMHTWALKEGCDHYGYFPSGFAVYPDILERAGYHTGFTGKGWGPGDFTRAGFTHNPAGHEYNTRTLTPPANTCISNRDYAGNFDEFLSRRPAGQPFCFWYGAHEPHRPYRVGEGVRAGKSIGSVDVPGYLPDDDIVKSDLLDCAYETEWFDHHLGLMIERLEAIGELDDTLIIVTSDNGMPFPRVKGQMYDYDFRLPMALCWRNRTAGGRRVDDLVSFVDLAPTFLEVAGLDPHPQMQGRSLMDIICSTGSGVMNPERNRAFMGRERHDVGRENDVGYPVRCIRTDRYLLSWNIRPDRWPAGNPETGFTNCDSSPTKTLILQQHEAGNDHYYNLAFGKRPEVELFDVIDDPDCLRNLANDKRYQGLKEQLLKELKEKLLETNDPRSVGGGDEFDTYEYVGDTQHSWRAYKEGRFKPQPY